MLGSSATDRHTLTTAQDLWEATGPFPSTDLLFLAIHFGKVGPAASTLEHTIEDALTMAKARRSAFDHSPG
jgi:hypothetical protein